VVGVVLRIKPLPMQTLCTIDVVLVWSSALLPDKRVCGKAENGADRHATDRAPCHYLGPAGQAHCDEVREPTAMYVGVRWQGGE
jgi:hypothetical protein